MSIGYIILAHKLPTQVRRLVSALLYDPSADIVLHVDKKARACFEGFDHHFEGCSRLTVISEYDVRWGRFSAVQALLRCLDILLRHNDGLSHVKHLSGQDYPIQPLSDFIDFIQKLGSRSLLEHNPLPWQVWVNGGDPSGGLDRLAYRHINVFGRKLRLPFRRRLPPDMPAYGGSALWCLCRAHAELVLRKAPSYRKWFQHGSNVDEVFFQTVLAGSARPEEIVNNDFTYVQWTKGHASPGILGCGDLSNIESSGCWFARKFDGTVDGAILDLLDKRIGADQRALAVGE